MPARCAGHRLWTTKGMTVHRLNWNCHLTVVATAWHVHECSARKPSEPVSSVLAVVVMRHSAIADWPVLHCKSLVPASPQQASTELQVLAWYAIGSGKGIRGDSKRKKCLCILVRSQLSQFLCKQLQSFWQQATAKNVIVTNLWSTQGRVHLHYSNWCWPWLQNHVSVTMCAKWHHVDWIQLYAKAR